jgi:hypothetical protein
VKIVAQLRLKRDKKQTADGIGAEGQGSPPPSNVHGVPNAESRLFAVSWIDALSRLLHTDADALSALSCVSSPSALPADA